MSLAILPRRAAVSSAKVVSSSSPSIWSRSLSTPVEDSFTPIVAAPPAPPAAGSALRDALNARAPRYNWTKDEIREIYNTPLMELAFQAVRSRMKYAIGAPSGWFADRQIP